MTIEYHWSAFGDPASVDGLESIIRRAAVEGFVGVIREYAEHGAWAFSDVSGTDLERFVVEGAATVGERFQAHSVFIRMDAGRRAVRWWLYPRSGYAMGAEVRWTPHAAELRENEANGHEALDELAARGRRYAEQWIEQHLRTTPSIGRREVRVEPRLKPFQRRDRRLDDLAQRGRDASSVAWSATADGRALVVIRQRDGTIVQSLLGPDEAEKLRRVLANSG